MTGLPTTAAAQITDWLLDMALGAAPIGEAIEGMALRLRAEGVHVDRVHVAYTTLHPLNRGVGVTWQDGRPIESESYGYERDPGQGWRQSPLYFQVTRRLPRLRRRLAGPGAMLDFPVLRGFAAEGATDYLLIGQGFHSFGAAPDIQEEFGTEAQLGVTASFYTRRSGGFSEDEIETLSALARPLGILVKTVDQRQVAVNLAECYIGRAAGPRVLEGAIRRGDVSSAPAVLWLSDLRGSTELSASISREAFIATLNDFFDATTGAVEAHGGETLTFIGDGALAIFPIDKLGETGAREAAWRAAQAAEANLSDLNTERATTGEPPLRWGLALHAGSIEYGNIGSVGRHTWSVIGPAVNETARIERATKTLDASVLASDAFVKGFAEDWRALGPQSFKGVPQPIAVFAPPVSQDQIKEISA